MTTSTRCPAPMQAPETRAPALGLLMGAGADSAAAESADSEAEDDEAPGTPSQSDLAADRRGRDSAILRDLAAEARGLALAVRSALSSPSRPQSDARTHESRPPFLTLAARLMVSGHESRIREWKKSLCTATP